MDMTVSHVGFTLLIGKQMKKQSYIESHGHIISYVYISHKKNYAAVITHFQFAFILM